MHIISILGEFPVPVDWIVFWKLFFYKISNKLSIRYVFV